MHAATQGDRFARVVGFLVFVLGLTIILMVVRLGLQMYHDPSLGIVAAQRKADAPAFTEISVGFGRIVTRIVLLFLGSLCGWFIAGRGIHLYLAGIPHSHTRDSGDPA